MVGLNKFTGCRLLGRGSDSTRRIAASALLVTAVAGAAMTDLAEVEFAANKPRAIVADDTLRADGVSAQRARRNRVLDLNCGPAGSDSLTVARAPDAEKSGGEQEVIQLESITVEGQAETAAGPVDGYVAGRSASGTKTDTPLIETPQSISVITRDRLAAQGVQRFDEALRYTTGVSTESLGFDIRQSSIQLRGFSGANQNIYRDGLQLRNPGVAAFLTPSLTARNASR